jgi:hypothetical protein
LKLWSLAAVALAALAGCTTDQGTLSIAAPYEVQLDARRLDLDTLPVVRDVEGSSTGLTSFLFVPTGTGPQLGDAVADAVANGGGDVLTRARVRSTKWWLLVGVETITVRGTVLDLPELP